MTDSFQFRDRFYDIVPPILKTGAGELYEYTLQLCTDLLMEKANQAIFVRFPGGGDPSQLPFLAFDRGLVQGPAEPDAGFAVRLREAPQTWALAGSARGVLQQLQAYLQGLQPGVPATYPLLTIVGRTRHDTVAQWQQLYQGDAIGALPTLTQVNPSNFLWDTNTASSRAWLVLPMSAVPTGQSGSAAQTTTYANGSLSEPGANVNGVWVPSTAAGPWVNAPWIYVTDLAGIVAANLGDWITLSGSSHPGNVGTFQVVRVLSSSSVVIANPNGVTPDAGPLAWSIARYPFLAPGLAWGAPGVTFGEGELVPPPLDTGSNVGGVWQPTTYSAPTSGTYLAWGLGVPGSTLPVSATLDSIRALIKTWKSASTYYPAIVVAFDCGSGVAGSAYSPQSSEGAGNPDGSFGNVGQNVNGVWVPTRLITSAADCYCQGTGVAQACTRENMT